jgi:hypothetical protein
MSNEPRKASEVLEELEAKVDLLLSLVKSQDVTFKLFTNKIQQLIKHQNTSANPIIMDNTQITAEAVDVKQLLVSAEDQLPLEKEPAGFRRTSRPETYSKQTATVKNTKPNIPPAEVIIPEESLKEKITPVNPNTNSVQVMQRVVDKNGKSIFLADVEIHNSKDEVMTIRTNGTGKWVASLYPDTYKIIITKRQSLTKSKLEHIQEVIISDQISPFNLEQIIL